MTDFNMLELIESIIRLGRLLEEMPGAVPRPALMADLERRAAVEREYQEAG